MKSRITLQHPKKKISRKKFPLKTFLFFLFLTVIFIGLFYVSRLKKFTIHDIALDNVAIGSDASYVSIASSSISGTYAWGLLPKNNIFIYPKQQIENDFLAAEIKQVSVKVNANTLHIAIEERTPAILWCQGTDQIQNCDYVDFAGVSFSSAPEIEGNAFLIFESSTTPSIGQSPLSSTTINEMLSASETLADHGFTLSHFSIEGSDATLTDTSGANVLIDLDKTASDTLYYLSQAISSSEFQTIKPRDIDYIDLRFGNKVIFKRRGEVETQSTTTNV